MVAGIVFLFTFGLLFSLIGGLTHENAQIAKAKAEAEVAEAKRTPAERDA